VRAQAQSFFGTVVTNQVCPQCQGLGEVVTTPCGKCMGAGRMKLQDTVSVKLPRGIDAESLARLQVEMADRLKALQAEARAALD
jgi:molecular chaperone DnaJ